MSLIRFKIASTSFDPTKRTIWQALPTSETSVLFVVSGLRLPASHPLFILPASKVACVRSYPLSSTTSLRAQRTSSSTSNVNSNRGRVSLPQRNKGKGASLIADQFNKE